MCNDTNYWLRRAERQARLAHAVSNLAVKRAHLELAQLLYQRAGIQGAPLLAVAA